MPITLHCTSIGKEMRRIASLRNASPVGEVWNAVIRIKAVKTFITSVVTIRGKRLVARIPVITMTTSVATNSPNVMAIIGLAVFGPAGKISYTSSGTMMVRPSGTIALAVA
jgi:hypothetical protein